MLSSHWKKSTLSASMGLAVAFCAVTVAPARAQAPATTTKAKARETAKEKEKARAAASARLDLNKATAEELQETLPGVGEVTARKIVAGRPYATVDDLSRAGVPARTIDQIRPLVVVTPPPSIPREKAAARPKAATPAEAPAAAVDLNTATPAQLETLPGVGPTHARDIIAARPFRSVDDLERVKGLGKARIDAIRDRVTLSTPTPDAPATVTRPVTTPPAAPATVTRPVTTPPAAPAVTKATPKSKSVARPAAKAATGRPINLNTASREELDALPGIGPVKAEAILEYRQATPFKVKEDVMKVKGIKEGEFARIKDLITVN